MSTLWQKHHIWRLGMRMHWNYPTDVTWTSLMMSLFPFWTRTVCRTYISNGGTDSPRTKSKISKPVFWRWLYGLGTTWRWVINDIIFGWTNPLNWHNFLRLLVPKVHIVMRCCYGKKEGRIVDKINTKWK